jgi:hypothetical protein
MANRIVMWDEATDEFADFVDELNEAMAAVFAGRKCPRVTVVDTGTDMFAVVVSSGDITGAVAQKVWDDANAEVGRDDVWGGDATAGVHCGAWERDGG